MPRFIYMNLTDAVFTATAQIEKYDAATQGKIKGAIKEGTTNIYEDAVRRAPMRNTGNLKRGIKMEVHTDFAHASGIVKTTAPHSHLVEFGTRQRLVYPVRGKALRINGHFVRGVIRSGAMPKRPFLRPAVEKERPLLNEAIARIIQ